jgi:hypothetical protein
MADGDRAHPFAAVDVAQQATGAPPVDAVIAALIRKIGSGHVRIQGRFWLAFRLTMPTVSVVVLWRLLCAH